jgi:glycosyltransferase involved in cell wall biosynthesis
MSELSVAYDREIFLLQKIGGVSNFFSSLISRFSSDKSYGINPHFTFERTNNFHLTTKFTEFIPQRGFLQANGGWSTLLTLGLIREYSSLWAGGKTKKVKADLFHATYYRPTRIEKYSGRKLVVSVHDFIPEKLGWTGVRNPHIGKERLCKNSDLVICVSQSTAQDLMEFYGIQPDRVKVIHHGVDLVHSAVAKKVSDKPSILYVGHREGYKNFKVLINAIRIALRSKVEIELVTVGPPLAPHELIENQDILLTRSWRHIENPPKSELESLYSSSTLHCVTSTMEGFGMTILESMAHGTPVILSDIPVFREVGGVAGCYFEPTSSEDLFEKILWALDSENYVDLSRKSLKLAQVNSWEHVAALYALAYHNIN